MKAAYIGAVTLAIVAACLLFVISCGDTKCKLCDDENDQKAFDCENMTRAFYACDIELSDLSFVVAGEVCVATFGGQLENCYRDCYTKYSKCGFWADCAENCETELGKWSSPDADDDEVADDDNATGVDD